MTTRRRNIRTQMEQELAAEEEVAQTGQQQEGTSPPVLTTVSSSLQGRLRSVEPLSSKPATQKAIRSSDAYTKVTYRLSNEAVQAAEDMKALLKRRYGFKRVNLEEVVEEALLAAQRDLEEHQEQGFLVQQLRQHKNNPANQ
jgi:hypothetical protein